MKKADCVTNKITTHIYFQKGAIILTDKNFKIIKYLQKSFYGSPFFLLSLNGIEYISFKDRFVKNTKRNREQLLMKSEWKEDLEQLFNSSVVKDKTTVIDMSDMFRGSAYLIESVDIETSHVTNMSGMFMDCYSLKSVNINTQNVIDMDNMFFNAISLKSIELNSKKVINMDSMFYGAESLESINLNTSNVTDMYSMFRYCKSLKRVDLNIENVTKITRMFFRCSSLKEVTFRVKATESILSKVSHKTIFGCCDALENVDIRKKGKY
jgi:surface protein